MLITLSGLDGAGKSTLIEWLKTALEQRNRRVAVYHMDHQVGLYAYLKFVRDRLAGETVAAQKRRVDGSNRKSVVWNKSLRRGVYLVDLLIFLFYRLYVETLRRQILIMDRYFYDRLVDVADGRRWFGIRFLALLTPTPQVPIYLDISPEEAYARKGEFSVEYLRRRQVTYLKVFRWIQDSVVLTAGGQDITASLRDLDELVSERIAVQ